MFRTHRPLMPFRLVLSILFLLLFAGSAPAEDQPAAQPKQTPPAQDISADKEVVARIPVVVEHEGTDSAGLRLAFHLKETFRKSSLFRLAKPEERHFSLRLVTREQFRDRPFLGSVYVVVWRYVESRDVLAHFLDERLGFADANAVAHEAEVIAEETDRVKGRYGYLLE